MQQDNVFLVVEDNVKCAAWQIDSMTRMFPNKRVVHARNLKEAHEALNDDRLYIEGILTDNGYPLVRGGERIGSNSIEGGAGTLLIKQIRNGSFGDDYQCVPIAWHTADIDDRKVDRVMGYEDATSEGKTYCFEKAGEPWCYDDMCEFLKQ